jgi:hypothetical protein
VTAIALPRPTPPQRRGRLRRRTLIAAVVVAAAIGILAARLASRSAATTAVQADTARFVPIPVDHAIEQAWGIRFVTLILGADRGVLDVRYQVTNTAKSPRIHGGSASPDPAAALKSLPTFIRESGGGKILPTSAMMHFEHFHFQTETLGSTFSILYGNSGGLLHVGDKVTIRMPDGLELHHVVISS